MLNISQTKRTFIITVERIRTISKMFRLLSWTLLIIVLTKVTYTCGCCRCTTTSAACSSQATLCSQHQTQNVAKAQALRHFAQDTAQHGDARLYKHLKNRSEELLCQVRHCAYLRPGVRNVLAQHLQHCIVIFQHRYMDTFVDTRMESENPRQKKRIVHSESIYYVKKKARQTDGLIPNVPKEAYIFTADR